MSSYPSPISLSGASRLGMLLLAGILCAVSLSGHAQVSPPRLPLYPYLPRRHPVYRWMR